MTRKQRRSAARIREARRRKEERFLNFVVRLVHRRFGDGLRWDFYSNPPQLGMPRAEFWGAGVQLCGGQAAYYAAGQLLELLAGVEGWDNYLARRPHVFIRSQFERMFDEDGTRL